MHFPWIVQDLVANTDRMNHNVCKWIGKLLNPIWTEHFDCKFLLGGGGGGVSIWTPPPPPPDLGCWRSNLRKNWHGYWETCKEYRCIIYLPKIYNQILEFMQIIYWCIILHNYQLAEEDLNLLWYAFPINPIPSKLGTSLLLVNISYKKVLEGQIFAESVTVALSSEHHYKLYQFQINFFVEYYFNLCILLLYISCVFLCFSEFSIFQNSYLISSYKTKWPKRQHKQCFRTIY